MRSLLLATSAIGLAGVAGAQTVAELQPAPAPVFAGTYTVANGKFTPSSFETAEGVTGECGLGRIFNQSAIPGQFFNSAGGNSVIDEGRIPSISGGGEADAYTVTSFPVTYATNVATVDMEVSFWNAGAGCADLATLGAPTASFILTGLPGTGTPGSIQSAQVNIDLVGGLEFIMQGDVNGVAGDADGDLFSWSYKILGQDAGAGDSTGFFIAGDPDNCAEGAGLFADTGVGCDGIGSGSGIGALDLFFQDADGTGGPGCFFFGGYPTSIFASFYMQLNTSLDNDGPDAATDLGMATGNLVDTDSCCATDSNFGTPFIAQDLFYTWTASINGIATIDTEGSDFDTRLTVYEGVDSSAVIVGTNDDGGTGTLSSLDFAATMGTTYLIQAGGFSGCGNLLVNADVVPDPCDVIMDDAFEDNDDQGSAVAIGDGMYMGLAAKADDFDFFNTVVCDGDTITVDALFIDADGDIDMDLLDASGADLDTSGTVSDNEQVTYTNTTGAPQVVTIVVFMFNETDCSNYDLVVAGSCNVGTQYCEQFANSTGNVGQILVSGSPLAADDDLSLVASNLPVGEAGLFVWSTAPDAIDLVTSGLSDGILCLGSGKGRFDSNIFTVAADGTASLVGIDTTMMPQSSMGPISIMTGDTGYFTAWFRDAAGTNGNNFTDAASITWQ